MDPWATLDDRFRIEEQKLALATATAVRGPEGDIAAENGHDSFGPRILRLDEPGCDGSVQSYGCFLDSQSGNSRGPCDQGVFS
jgi:hypothetical protein